jgi:hypothetical protein
MSYVVTMIIGMFASTLIGIHFLKNFIEIDDGKYTDMIMGGIFLTFGVVVLFTLLDNFGVIIYRDRIEIKSLFRRRIIFRAEIIGFGKKKFRGKYLSGEKLIVVSNKKKFTFTSTQLESLVELDRFLTGKRKLNDAFKGEMIIENIIWILIVGAAIGIIIFGLLN